MDFSDALRAMKDGKRVRRAMWKKHTAGAVVMEIAALSLPDGTVIRQMIVRYDNGNTFTFGGSQWDILSEDWEVAAG